MVTEIDFQRGVLWRARNWALEFGARVGRGGRKFFRTLPRLIRFRVASNDQVNTVDALQPDNFFCSGKSGSSGLLQFALTYWRIDWGGRRLFG